MSQLKTNIDIGSKAVRGTDGICRSTGRSTTKMAWKSKLPSNFVQGRYVHEFKIIYPFGVVDNKNNCNSTEHACLTQCQFNNIYRPDRPTSFWTTISEHVESNVKIQIATSNKLQCWVGYIYICIIKGTILRIVIQSFVNLWQIVEIIKYKQL